MTKDEAVSLALAYVRARYPLVPPVCQVLHATERTIHGDRLLRVEGWTGHPSPSLPETVTLHDGAALEMAGRWLVQFSLSQAMPVAGMPRQLMVLVSDHDAAVTAITDTDEEAEADGDP